MPPRRKGQARSRALLRDRLECSALPAATGDESIGKRLDRLGQGATQLAVYGKQGLLRTSTPTCSNCVMTIDNFFVTLHRVLDDPRIKPIDGDWPGDFLDGFSAGNPCGAQ